ncbi:MAG: 30S ribosomal protein S12 methylthiotransferase RimO [Lentisphaeraceae bacterium]|nr:30S ribosomal protein S12 methylthiotransferase RimO [Lentisphaeraceae bacterium]
MPKSAKICISSLGCAKNLVDTEVMLGSLAKSGVTLTNDLTHADIFVVNTCSFIDGAREESNGAIRDAIKWKKKKRHRKVVVAGCLPQRLPEETKKNHPNVDLFLGLDEVANVGTMVQNLLRKIPTINTFNKEDLPVYLYDENTPRLLVTPSHYAYIKISEGCNHKCSFCAIPTFRGKLRSRTIMSIVKEAQALLNQGIKEIILVSQDSTGYGSDLKDGSSTAELLKALDKLDADEYWVRLLYLYPTTVTDDLIDTFAASKHIAKYIDMPLQHASDNVLKVMRRGINKKRTEILLQKFRDKIPGVTMRTTLLVGHPGEEEQDFEVLRDFVKEQKFDRVGIFTYSHEENTHAFSMDEYADKATAERRRDQLMEIQQDVSYENNQRFVDKEVKVIIDDVFEDEEGEVRCIGRTEGDAPDVDNQVHFAYDERIGDGIFATVKIFEADAYDLFGEVVFK